MMIFETLKINIINMDKSNENGPLDNFSSTKNLIISELFLKKQSPHSLRSIPRYLCFSEQKRYLHLGFFHHDQGGIL